MNIAAGFLERNRQRLGLDEFGIQHGHSSLILTPRFEASRHVIFLVIPHGRSHPTLVVKVPRLTEETGSLAREARSLREVHTLRPGGFSSIPRVIAFEEHCGCSMLVQTALTGPLMAPDVVRARPQDCCRRVLAWLLELQHASLHESDGSWFARLVERPLEYFASAFPLADDDAALLARSRAIVQPLRDARLPFVCEHGDVSHPNLIVDGDGVAVIDWELARMDGLVAHDLFMFLAYVAFSRRKARSPQTQLKAFDEAFFEADAWTLPFVRAYAAGSKLQTDWLAPLFVLSWARYTVHLLQRITGKDDLASARIAPGMAASVRAHRYYRMWKHAASHTERLAWTG